jgi:NTE family protein
VRVALALGAGGARGYAHIGAIQVLRDAGHEIVGIAGTSMGAVVGGIEAAGQLGAFTDWVTTLRQRDVVRMLDVKLAGPGVIGANRILGKLRDLTGEVDIEDLPIAFTAVATDLDRRREVWFQSGSLHTAVRASIAIPGVFTPAIVDGRVLVDGGVVDPVPIEPLVPVPADVVVAVSLSAQRTAVGTDGTRRAASPSRRRELIQRVRAARTTGAESRQGRRVEAEVADPKVSDLILRSLDTMQSLITRYRLAARPPDVLVEVPANACGTLEFHRASELIELGRTLTERALDHAGW